MHREHQRQALGDPSECVQQLPQHRRIVDVDRAVQRHEPEAARDSKGTADLALLFRRAVISPELAALRLPCLCHGLALEQTIASLGRNNQ